MGDRHRYKPRDFDFAQLLVTLRKKASLTQEAVALRMGVGEKSIRNWEGGSHYPSEVNLQKLIELYFDQNVFAPGHEQDEARALWEQLRESSHRRIGIFDEQWFAALLKGRQTPSSQAHKSDARVTPPSDPSSRLRRGDWREMLGVSALYGRSDELAELEQWLLSDRCRLVAVLGMGGIGKTALAVKLVQQVAPHFDCVLWRSLHNAPALDDVLLDWIPVLSQQRDRKSTRLNSSHITISYAVFCLQ